MMHVWWVLLIFFLVMWSMFRSFGFALFVTGGMWWWNPTMSNPLELLSPDVKSFCHDVYLEAMTFIYKYRVFFVWWYAVGIIGSLAWPVKYRHELDIPDKLKVLFTTPFLAVSGPFAFLLGMPV